MTDDVHDWPLELVESYRNLFHAIGDPAEAAARRQWMYWSTPLNASGSRFAHGGTFRATQIREKFGRYVREAPHMKVITIMEDGERARSVYVRTDGDGSVFDLDRKFRFRTDISSAETIWPILEWVVPAIVEAETARLKIEALAARCRTGWRSGYPDEIDPNIPQRTLRRAVWHRPAPLSGRRRVLQPGHHFDGSRRERSGPGDRRDLLDLPRQRVGSLRGRLLVDASGGIEMARFRCRACGREGEFTYDPTRHECPRCGSPDAQFGLGIDEMPEELIDRIMQALSQAKPLDDHPTDED